MTIDSEDKKNLRLSIVEMQEELVQLRQAVAQSMTALKRQELQYNRSQVQLEEYDRRALQALQNGDQNLANENLSHKENYVSLVETLKSELDLQSRQVHTLRKDLLAIEVKIFKAKSELSGEILIPCFTTTKPVIIGEKTVSITEIGVDEELEYLSRFTKLEAGNSESNSNVDAKLAALKAEIMADSLAHQIVLHPSNAAKIE
jgi:phage shock protein A